MVQLLRPPSWRCPRMERCGRSCFQTSVLKRPTFFFFWVGYRKEVCSEYFCARVFLCRSSTRGQTASSKKSTVLQKPTKGRPLIYGVPVGPRGERGSTGVLVYGTKWVHVTTSQQRTPRDKLWRRLRIRKSADEKVRLKDWPTQRREPVAVVEHKFTIVETQM